MSLAAGEELLSELELLQLPLNQARVLDLLNMLLMTISNDEGENYLLSRVHPDHDTRRTAEDQARRAQHLRTRLLQNRRVFATLAQIDETSLDPLARRALALTRNDMRRLGAELNDAQRDRVASLRTEIAGLEQAFARNIREDTRSIELIGPAELEGLPSDYVRGHPPGIDGVIRVGTEPPDYEPFMTYATSERARSALVRQFYTRGAPANLDVLDGLLSKRHALATALGYASWADYVTEDKMVGSAANAAAFLRQVQERARSSVQAKLRSLLDTKRHDHPGAENVGVWESAYYQQQVNRQRLAFDARNARPYFAYSSVKAAIFDLSSDLFGLRFRAVDEPRIWHPSVETFEVDMDGELAGRISLDMYPRPGKHKGASCAHWRFGVAGQQLPHVVLICNFAEPTSQSGPALMDHHELVVFFHEFGHLVHALAGRNVPWVRLAQPSERDFIEAPSQMLEEWVFDYEVLRRFARHVDTGESIPPEMVEGLRQAHESGRALWAQWLLFRATVSLRLHECDPKALDLTRLVFDLAHEYSPYELPPESHFAASFDHLRNYSALYYTYLWSQAIAADLLSAFRDGLFDVERTRRYRDMVLAPGGSKPAEDLVADFLGRPWTFDALARWLAPGDDDSSGSNRSAAEEVARTR